ncbi:hypothetical protein CWATWH0005_1841 [Crocosphaera watsonii WH 0005]|uniref:Uncharacterized protein n=1 Tax=Crocosphaera watsonii WH 0005 TaxID=423472 RepID=T2IPH2_CROWT|nr:hypothetical protein CWATWH0005_1841 [Crocosphaera watsonii WH 0005]
MLVDKTVFGKNEQPFPDLLLRSFSEVMLIVAIAKSLKLWQDIYYPTQL